MIHATSAEVVWHKGLWLCHHLVGRVTISTAHASRNTWNFPHLEEAALYFLVKPQAVLLSAIVLWLNMQSADNTPNRQDRNETSSLWRAATHSWRHTHCFCVAQCEMWSSVPSQHEMQQLIHCSRSQARVERVKYSGIIFPSTVIWLKHSKTTCIESCQRERTEVAFWRLVWLTVNYTVWSEQEGPMWHPDDTHLSINPPLWESVFLPGKQRGSEQT